MLGIQFNAMDNANILQFLAINLISGVWPHAWRATMVGRTVAAILVEMETAKTGEG